MTRSGSLLPEFGQPLSLLRQVAQLVVVPVSARLGSLYAPAADGPYPSREVLRKLVQEVGIGGIWLQGGHVAEAILLLEQLQEWAALPLLVAVNASRGLPLQGATAFPHPLGLSRLGEEAESWAEQWGRIVSREAAALGINWLLNPWVASQPGGDSYPLAEDPNTVLALARAFVAGCEQTALAVGHGILTTAAAFPGMVGSELPPAADLTPTNLPWRPLLTLPVAQLQETLWLPFRQLIHQVGAILVSHVVLPEWDERWPITLLPGRLTQLLRQEWGFTGLIVVDALDQGFLAELADPVTLAVRALQAGADLLLSPPEPLRVIQGIAEAVQAGYGGPGSLNPTQIAQSVTRVLRAKERTIAGVSPLLQEVWPALAETDFSSVAGWMGATGRTDPGGTRGSPAEQLKPVLLGDPISKDSALGKLFSGRPGLPARCRPLERLGLLLTEPDIAPCQAAMARGGVEGGQPFPWPPEPGWWNWIWQDPPACELHLESPALAIPLALRIPPLCSDPLTPLPLLEEALAKATGLLVQCFVEGDLPTYVLDLLQRQQPQIGGIVLYGNLPLYRRLQAQFPQLNTVHSLNRDPVAQREVMRRLFPQLGLLRQGSDGDNH